MKKNSASYNEINRLHQFQWMKFRGYLFSVLLLVLFMIGLCFFLRPQKSVLEKRTLHSFPSFSLQRLWNGHYFTDLQTWYADTYPLREPMIFIQTKAEQLYGFRSQAIYGDTVSKADAIPKNKTVKKAPTLSKDNASPSTPSDGTIHNTPEVAGTIYIANNQGFETYYFSKTNADAYASMLNTVKTKLPAYTTLYDIVIPNSFGVCLDEKVQSSMGASSQKDAISYIYDRLDSSIRSVPIYDTLRKHNSEYLYFHTDHHWTALAAYYAYQDFCRKKGIAPHTLQDYKKVTFPNFIGSFYAYSNQSPALLNNPDTVEAYLPISTNEETFINTKGQSISWKVVKDVSTYAQDAKYNCFIGGDEPFCEIDNPTLSDNSSCLILKESYGNAFVPFLVDHYQHVYVVDYRYYHGNLTAFVNEHSISDVIFMNNTEAVTQERAAIMNRLFPAQ